MRKTGRCVFAAVLAAALLCTMPGMISCAEAGAVSESSAEQEKAGATGQTEADTAEPAKADTAKPTETDAAKPVETDATKPAKADTAKPTETDAVKPVETDTTKPAKADEAKTTETDTAKPEEADTAKPAETDTAKPEETDQTKPAEDGVSAKTGTDGNDTKAPAADGDEITKAEPPVGTPEENTENTEKKNTGAEDADSNLDLIEELMADLPNHVTGDNAETVRAKLDEILDLYRELTEEEQEQIDISCCLKLQEELDAANDPDLTQDIVTTELDFTNVGDGNGQTPAVGPGYRWSGDAGSGYLLELNGFQMMLPEDSIPDPDHIASWAIRIPVDGEVTIQIDGENNIVAPNRAVFRCKDYTGSERVVIQGSGSLTTDSDTFSFFSKDLVMKNVTVRANSGSITSGIRTDHGDITLESVDFQMKSTGANSACIWTSKGSMTIRNSKIQLDSDEFPPLYIREGNLTVEDSELNLSSNFHSGIYIASDKTPEQSNVFSGETTVSINCTSTQGIFSKGDLVVEAPAKLTAIGVSRAFTVYKGITLRGTAVVSPTDGIITTFSGSSNEYTAVGTENLAATSVEIKPVELTVSLDNTEYRYGSAAQATVTADAGITGTVSIYNGEELLGTADLGEVISIDTNNLGAGNHTLTAKLQENKGDVSKEFTLTVTKTVPTVTAPTATAIQYGQKLSESALSGGTAADPGTGQSVEGTWAWKDGNILPLVENDGYFAVFTPTDADKYDIVETKIALTVGKAQNAPNMPGSTMKAAANIEKVGDVSLPEGWEWQASDWNTLLEAGKPVSAVAVYTGTDKGNYETETVAVTITRMPGSQETEDPSHTGEDEKEPSHTGNPHRHSYTESVTRQPACTDIGVRTYTCACGDSYTENIAALGHHYSGTVTKQPTTASEGIMTYICDRCGDSYTESIAKLQKENTVKTNNNRHSQPEDTEPESDSAEKTESPGDDGTGKAESEPGIPFIKDENGKIGWDVIRAEEEKAKEGSVINVDMNGATVVPGNIFDSIKGKDITITFDMGDGIIWNVDGRSITRNSAPGKAGDVDFGMETGVSAIPVDIVNNMTGESYSIQLSIAYEGEFGFTAVLLIDLGKENAGLTASLYYYNESTEELEFICADEVAQDGTASLAFTHASDYVIVVDGEAEENGVAAEDAKGQNRTDESAEDIPENSETGQTWWLWWIIVIILLAAIGTGVLLAVKKKREEEDGGE